MKKTITPFVLAIIKKKNKYLLTKRQEIDKEDPNEFLGMWQLPGGGVKFGESVENALLREVKEETDLEIRVISVVPYFINSIRKNWHGIGIVLLCEMANQMQMVKLNEEANEYNWFTYKEVIKLEVLPGVKDALKASL